MPSKPLFGMPVAVGMSAAVMAMRSVVSAIADCDDSVTACQRHRAECLANEHDVLRSHVIRVWIRRKRSKFQASHARRCDGDAWGHTIQADNCFSAIESHSAWASRRYFGARLI